MADGDLPLLASLLPKPQNALGPLVLKIPSPQTGHGAQYGPTAQAHDVGGVDRAEQIPGLLDGEAWGLAVRGVVLAAADRLEGIEWRGVPGHQSVEEIPQLGQGLVLGRAVPGELVDEAAGAARRDPGEIEGLQLASGEEAPHHAGVGAAGVGIGDPGGEELIGREEGIAAGALEDYWE